MSQPKELDFFATPLHRARGVGWYRRRFDATRPVRGESSPNYTAHPLPSARRRFPLDPAYLGVPERMHALVPDARLIYMVRDPVERIGAQWHHLASRGLERRALESAVMRRSSTYLARSSYCFQLERFLERYPADQVMVVDRDDLLHRRRGTLVRIFRFLGVDDAYWEPSYEQERHVTAEQRRRTALGLLATRALPRLVWGKLKGRRPFSVPFRAPDPDEDLRRRLAEALADDVARFRALTGRRFEHWSV